jgi:hypothetical protein
MPNNVLNYWNGSAWVPMVPPQGPQGPQGPAGASVTRLTPGHCEFTTTQAGIGQNAVQVFNNWVASAAPETQSNPCLVVHTSNDTLRVTRPGFLFIFLAMNMTVGANNTGRGLIQISHNGTTIARRALSRVSETAASVLCGRYCVAGDLITFGILKNTSVTPSTAVCTAKGAMLSAQS